MGAIASAPADYASDILCDVSNFSSVLDSDDTTVQKALDSIDTWGGSVDSELDDLEIDDWNTAYGWGNHADAGYLTSEVNDLADAVTWANVPDANITETSVTQHEGALEIIESQISDLDKYTQVEVDAIAAAQNQLSELTDVNIDSTLVDNHILQYDSESSLWVNQPFDGCGGSRSATLIVAASDAAAASISGADYTCDGIDDEVQINAAIAALPDGGGRIVFTEGRFVTGGAIIMDDYVSLMGQGRSTIIQIEDSHDTNINMIDCTGDTDIIIRDITLDGNKGNQNSGTMNGIYFNQSLRSRIEDCFISNLRDDGIYNVNGSLELYIINNDISLCDQGINIATANDSVIQGNISHDNVSHGITINNCDGTTVTGNTSQDNGGIGIYSLNGTQNTTISVNTCDNNTSHGINVHNNSPNNTLTGNTCNNNTGHGIYVYASSEIIATGNQCDNNGADGIAIGNNGKNCVFTGNGCYSNTAVGIDMDGGSECTISSNVIAYNGQHGIYINGGDNNTISGNHIQENSQSADNTYDGININNGSDGNDVQTNTIRHGGAVNQHKYGINIGNANCDDNVVANNDIKDSGKTDEFHNVGTGTIAPWNRDDAASTLNIVNIIMAENGTISAAAGNVLSTSNIEVTKVDPESRLTDTGDSEYTRVTRSDTNALAARYNRCLTSIPVYALDLDGIDDYVYRSQQTWNISTTFTIGLWFRTLTSTDDYIFELKHDAGVSKANSHFISISSDKLRCVVSDSAGTFQGDEVSTTSINDDDWHLGVFTFNGTQLRLYVDGSQEASDLTVTGTFTDTLRRLYIGINRNDADNAFNSPFDGQIDEIAMWSKVLSANDISDWWDNGPGLYLDKDNSFPTDSTSIGTDLEALWHLDEGTGSSAADSSDNSNTCTLVNMTEEDWVEGHIVNPESGDAEVLVWSSQDGGSGEAGIQTFGDGDGRTVLDGVTVRFLIGGVEAARFDANSDLDLKEHDITNVVTLNVDHIGENTATNGTIFDDVAIMTDDLKFTGEGSGLIYGSCYGNHIGWSQAAAVQNTWYNIADTDMVSGELNGVTHNGNGELAVTEPGRFTINYTICLENSVANDHIETGIEVSGSGSVNAAGQTHVENKFANEEEHLSGTCILDLADNATIEVAIRTTDASTPTISVQAINITCVQTGGT